MNGRNDNVSIHELERLPEDICVLQAQAVAEGFRFLTRLIKEWEDRSNRFDQPGECLLGVFFNGQLIAIGGVSRDPCGAPKTARLRRVYVMPALRGHGVGKQLVAHLCERASERFSILRLSTDTLEGARFYLRCGFHAIADDGATHEKSLITRHTSSPN
ncbi:MULTISPECIES: GNAT family N-acetyltransferase [Pseudomonas]|uniref:GNAT family N-acetyltransferase n=1 Tax=Pseudomonas TaxID=286 RepID=UPI00273669AB|nr:GNAT family N-acetyltransferase [Pseudomonas sp. FP597]WLI04412.1 GNAT family N-acetyltransferase [Pseudomonas sp. FP597]